MQSFYRVEIFSGYAALVCLIAGVVPLWARLKSYHSVPTQRTGLLTLVFGAFFFCLSLTCPFPLVKRILQGAAVILSSLGGAAILFGLVVNYALYRDLLIPMRRVEADQWATQLMRGRFLVLDTQTRVLAGQIRMEGVPEVEQGEVFPDYLSRWLPKESPDGKNLMRSASRWAEAAGVFNSESFHFEWRLSPLQSGDKRAGSLFLINDFAREYGLLKELEKQEKLLKFRVRHLETRGRREAEGEKVMAAARLAQSCTEAIQKELETLCSRLSALEQSRKISAEGIDDLLASAEQSMTAIRRAVHAIPGGKGTQK